MDSKKMAGWPAIFLYSVSKFFCVCSLFFLNELRFYLKNLWPLISEV